MPTSRLPAQSAKDRRDTAGAVSRARSAGKSTTRRKTGRPTESHGRSGRPLKIAQFLQHAVVEDARKE
jgi:hypothetical protein